MFFVISKILGYLILPLPFIFLLFSLYWGFKKKSFSKYFLIPGIAFSFIFTNDFLGNAALKLLEQEPVEIKDLEQYQVGVVLTGLTKALMPLPDKRVNFSEAADRLTDAIYLYKYGTIKKILITGGSPLFERDYKEADVLKEFLLVCGIPKEDIIIENKAQNTYQNAKFTAELLKRLHIKDKVLLITSAFHMRRTKACFDKFEVKYDVFPTDYLTYPISKFNFDFVFPTQEALIKWNHFNKELMGYIVYKIVGYI